MRHRGIAGFMILAAAIAAATAVSGGLLPAATPSAWAENGQAEAAHSAVERYVIRLDPSVEIQPKDGRVILAFITETGRQWNRRSPMEAPFYEKPQPIASIAVERFGPGDSVEITDENAVMFGGPLSAMNGRVRVQAIFNHDTTERSHEQGPGNVYSDVLTLELAADRADAHEIVLTNVIPPPTLPENEPDLRWIEFRSEMLSEFYGRDVYHRAGVALPPGHNDPDHPRQTWPAIYEIGGFGSRHTQAAIYAMMFRTRGIEEVAPMAVLIVLDPESPLGHHGFTDTENHGPRGTALVKEFIPHLEEEFRMVAKPQARIVTGHSSGGWTSLWLQLQWPDVFGACFSSAPDPIDFTAFQMSNIYEDESMFVMADGSEMPSYRRVTFDRQDVVLMTVREEVGMEYALHPLGGSGQQWDTWAAMFSPKDEQTGFPKRMFDPSTGKIDREVAEHWKQFDITRMVREDWEKYGPIVTERVRLVCGELDDYYLNRAVDRFRAMVEEKTGTPMEAGDARRTTMQDGYVFMHEHATHGSIMRYMTNRWNREMRDHLRRHGLME
jgi:pimeloyl-ACP methyl ester carboxylesterase